MTDIVELNRTRQLNNTSVSQEDDEALSRPINEGMWDWDLQTDVVVYSVKWKKMLGYQEHELEDHLNTWKSIIHPDDLEPAINRIQVFVESDLELLETQTRLKHRNGKYLHIRGIIFKAENFYENGKYRLLGYHVNSSLREKNEQYNTQSRKILEMIARGAPARKVYNEIARLYENRYPGMRCSMLELEGNTLIHGGAPSLPKEYCDAINGLKNGPDVGSCGSSTYIGKRVLVENIELDPKWKNLKHHALPHGMKSCWSEPIKGSTGVILGAFGMYYNYPALPTKEESDDLTAAAMLAGIVMERDHNQKRIHKMAFTDELTGLHSRGYGKILLNQLLEKSLNNGQQFAVIYLDLDNFKSINDNFGHDIGDIHLKKVSERLIKESNDEHIISRLGADEFCIMIPTFQNKEEVENIAQKYLAVVSKPILLAERKFVQTASLGIALFPQDSDELKSLDKLADTALFYAKKKIKNSYVFYDPEQSKSSEYHFKLEQLLREAITHKELTQVYQAKIDFHTKKVNGLEVLCRWHHSELGFVSPLEFIDIAERIGMISALTEQIMETSFTQFMQWKAQGLNFGSVAINISPSLLIEPDFIELVKNTINKTGMQPQEVELEITESFSQTEKESLTAIAQLKALGVGIAIDDFGQGYSCFASLRQMDIDVLKIDKLFINDLASDKKAEQLVKSMIEMAHALDCKVVAEGIETKEQFQLLENLGCDLAQGFLLNKPTSPDLLPQVLAQSKLL